MTKRKLSSTNTINRDYLKNECDTVYALMLLSGRWKMIILHKLSQQDLRFGELKERIPNITDRMLTLHLKEMEKDGLIERKVFAEIPPRVEYRLTSISRELVLIGNKLEAWGGKHRLIHENNKTY